MVTNDSPTERWWKRRSLLLGRSGGTPDQGNKSHGIAAPVRGPAETDHADKRITKTMEQLRSLITRETTCSICGKPVTTDQTVTVRHMSNGSITLAQTGDTVHRQCFQKELSRLY